MRTYASFAEADLNETSRKRNYMTLGHEGGLWRWCDIFAYTYAHSHTSAALCKRKKRRVSCHCVNITTGARPVSFRHHQLRPHTIQRLAGSPRIPEEQHNTIHVVPPAPTHVSKASKIHKKEKRDFRLPNISTKLHTRFRRKSAGDVTTVS